MRITPIIGGLLLAALFLSFSASAETMKVVYGFGREFPPFSYEKDGQPVGFDVELLQTLLQDQDVKIVYRPMDWNRVLLDLSSGNIHITSGMARTPQRELLYKFATRPTMSLKVRLFTQVQNRVPNVIQLRGRRVAVQENTLYQRVMEDFGGLNIKHYASHIEGLKALANGEVEGFGGPDKTAQYYMDKLGISGISPVGTPLKTADVYFALNRDQTALLDMINNGMREILENGVYHKLYRQWFIPDLENEVRDKLLLAAKDAAISSYAPYSQAPMGAAVLGRSGVVYTGGNVENGDRRLNHSALTVAILNAVSQGETELTAALSVTPDGRVQNPDAVSRRLLLEFGGDTLVVTEPEPGLYINRTLFELLPNPFTQPTAESVAE